MKRLLLASLALASIATPSFAIDLGRCQNLPDIITPDTVVPGADITEQRDVFDTRDVFETRDITELRDILADQKQYANFPGKTSGGGHDGRMLRCQLPGGAWSLAPSIDQFGQCGPGLSLTGGDYGSGQLAAIVKIKVGEETVKIGEETVKVGEETIKVGEETIVIGQEPDTIILVPDISQYQTGVVDVKDTAKAYAAAVIAAIKNGDPIPKPGPQFEVIDWNPVAEGSC